MGHLDRTRAEALRADSEKGAMHKGNRAHSEPTGSVITSAGIWPHLNSPPQPCLSHLVNSMVGS